jgi:hypothetical protein
MLRKKYYFYSKVDKSKEAIARTSTTPRLKAAKYFAAIKQLDLKSFLSVFTINK